MEPGTFLKRYEKQRKKKKETRKKEGINNR